jgi:hypothetical protein
MSTYYDQWDKNDSASKNRKVDDTQDKKASARGEPKKMVVPLTASQIDTFVSFCYMVFTQRERVFEMFGSGSEDQAAASIAEALLERDLDHSDFRGTLLLQFLYNVCRCNLGVLKHTWVEETTTEMVEQAVEVPPQMGDMTGVPTMAVQEVEQNGYPVRW